MAYAERRLRLAPLTPGEREALAAAREVLLRERRRLARTLLECASKDRELRKVMEEAGLSEERVEENLAAVLKLA